MVLPDSFFSDRTVSQILAELMDIRRDCQSWLAVGEAHSGLTHGGPETGFFYENTQVAARILGKKPGFFVGVRPGLSLSRSQRKSTSN